MPVSARAGIARQLSLSIVAPFTHVVPPNSEPVLFSWVLLILLCVATLTLFAHEAFFLIGLPLLAALAYEGSLSRLMTVRFRRLALLGGGAGARLRRPGPSVPRLGILVLAGANAALPRHVKSRVRLTAAHFATLFPAYATPPT
jgi:hypothetical protein